jgi:hypothetical protein
MQNWIIKTVADAMKEVSLNKVKELLLIILATTLMWVTLNP